MVFFGKSNKFLSFTHGLRYGCTVICFAIGLQALCNGLRAADTNVENLQSFSYEDSLFRQIYDPNISAENGTGWMPYNRHLWFTQKRAYPNDAIPVNARINAWEEKLSRRRGQPSLDENWTSIGPSNMAGRILCIAFHPTDSTIIYTGSASGGLWKSVNSGSTWTPLTDDLASLSVSTVAIDPTNPSVIYIGTGEGSFNTDAVYGAGIFKSLDGGTTWNSTGLSWTQSQGRAVNKIVINPANTQILYAAMNSAAGGVWKSVNGGTTWTAYHVGDVKELYMAPDSSNVLYCANGYPWGSTNNGVWKSVNSGVNWTSVSTGLPSGLSMGRSSLTVSTSNPQVLYLGVSQTISGGSGLLGVYKSVNGGATWTRQSNSPNFYNGQGWYDNVIAVDPQNTAIVYSAGLDLYKSTDNAVTWTRMTFSTYAVGHSQYAHSDHHAFAFNPLNRNSIYCGTDGGIFRSYNAGTAWTGINSGLVTLQFYAMGNDLLNTTTAFGGTQDNGTNKYTNSSTWTNTLGGDGGYCIVDPANSNIVYAETQRGTHYRSTNGGTSYSTINTGLIGYGPWVTPVAMDPSNSAALYTTASERIFKTINSGTSWTAVSPVFSSAEIHTIAVAPSAPATVYCGLAGGGAVHKTTDGINWSNVSSGLPDRAVTRLAVDPFNANIVYATLSGYGSGHVYKTVNGGTSWNNFSTGLLDVPCNAIVIDQHNANNLYVATDLGVYFSSDAGANWADYSTGLPNVVVDDLAIHPSTGVLRAATHGRGMWATPTTTPGVAVLYPNGGENLIIGTSYTITWSTGGLGGTVNVELNTNYPAGAWTTLATGTSNDGNLVWTPGGTASSSVRVRVTHTTNGTQTDISNTNFSLNNPSIILSAPNGGETWPLGSAQTVTWTSVGFSGTIAVELNRSYPNSGTWEFLGTSNTGSYNWTVTGATTNTARFKVYNLVNAAIADTSAANFIISNPSLTLNNPNGGEVLTPASFYTIRWTRQNLSGTVKVELNTNYPAGSWTTLAAAVTPDSLVWNVPATGTANARIRVTSNSLPSVLDISNANFTIQTPTLAVTSPNGGENWSIGSAQVIRWNHSNFAGAVNVYINYAYSGGAWNLLGLNITADSLAWTVTNNPTATARVRVSSVNLPSYLDESNANFTISNPASSITVTAPNGGENWTTGTAQNITWTRNNANGAATVELNRTYPTGAWEVLTTTPTGNSYSWTVSGAASTTARVRVSLTANSSVNDASNANFTITAPPQIITVTAPNGGENWTTGTAQNITWTRTNANGAATVQINYTYPSGSWTTLTTTPTGNSYSWTVSGTPSTNCRARVFLTATPSVSDTSNANFTIADPVQIITVTAPNGGENWTTGTAQNITWTRTNANGAATVQINYTYPSGSWTTLTTTPTGNSYSWTVSGTPSTNCRARVFLTATPSVSDTSNANFTIADPIQIITVTAPNGGENWTTGTAQNITWTRNNATGAATVQINYTYPSGSWTTLTTTPTGNSYSWTVSGTPSTNCRARVFLTATPSVSDTSNADFTIADPVPLIVVTAPNGGESWGIGSSQNITWTRSNANGAVTIELNRNFPSGGWETLTNTPTGNSYSWTVSGAATANARVRVFLNSNNSVRDSSNANFSLVDPAIIVTNPVGGETWAVGSPVIIQWTRVSAAGNATVQLNRSFPSASWETLTTTASGNSFNWTVTAPASNTCRIRVFLTANPTLGDTCNSNFNIVTSSLTLTAPVGGETWSIGTLQTIRLSRFNAAGNVTVALNRDYPTGAWENLSTTVSIDTFNWTVIGAASANARIKIFLTANGSIGDTTSASLSIVNPTITLTAPNGGESWIIGQPYTVRFTRNYAAGAATVQLNRNFSVGAWETLSSSVTADTFQWTTNGAAGANSRIRVFLNSYSSARDSSDANFSLVIPSIAVNSPNGGESWQVGNSVSINWTRNFADGNAIVSLNRNYPAGSWETLSSAQMGNSMSWTVTSPATSSARVRVRLSGDTTVSDESNANFSVIQPTLTLSYPNGAEQITLGAQMPIRWSRASAAGNVTVELNRSYPSASWETLSSTVSIDSLIWNSGGAPSSSARVRVYLTANPAVGDTSNANFSLVQRTLQLASHNSGGIFYNGSQSTVSLSRTSADGSVTLQLNRSYPSASWETLTTTEISNSYLWNISGSLTTTARLRAFLTAEPFIGDTSNLNFSIANPTLTLLTPNGGELWPLDSVRTISWSKVGSSGNVNLEIKRLYPVGSWEVVANNVSGNSYNWTINGSPSTTNRIRVSYVSNSSIGDTSNANFETQAASVTLTNFNGGESLLINSLTTVHWSRAVVDGEIRCELNRDYPAGSWELIGSLMASLNADSLSWIPGGSETANARLRVYMASHPQIGDTSDANFSLVQQSLTLTSPHGNDTLVTGSTATIRWTRGIGSSGPVKVELNRNFPSGSWDLLSASVNGDSLNWTVSGAATANARFKVSLVSSSNINDVTDANSTILIPSVFLLEPSVGDSFAIGDTVRFQWQTLGVDPRVNVYIKRVWPGGSWESLGSSLQGGAWNWIASGAASNTARYRILSTVNNAIGDTTDGAVPLGQPALAITSPNAAQTYRIGESLNIQWNRSYAPGIVRVELSRGGTGGPWELIGTTSENNLLWNVSGNPSSTVRIKISLQNASWVSSMTAFNSSIVQPALVVTQPTANSVNAIGRNLIVAWTRTHLAEPMNVYLDRHIPAATLELLRSNITADSVHWTIAGTASDSAEIILQTASGLSFSASSHRFRLGIPRLEIFEIEESHFLEGEVVPIRWQRDFISDPVNVYICRSYPVGGWNLLANSVNDSFYNWTVDNSGGNNTRFRVQSAVDPALADSTEQDILLTPLSLSFTAPDSGVRLPVGFSASVSWTRTGVSGLVNLYLSRNGGASFPELIASNQSGDSYLWIPSGAAAANAKLRIVSNTLPAVADTSASFIIAVPAVQLNSFNSGEIALRDSSYQIQWTTQDHPSAVNIQFNRSYPSGAWETLASNLSGNSFNWIPTGSLSDHCRLRIVSAVNNSWNDESNQDFMLTVPGMAFTLPAEGAELLLGDQLSVAWQISRYSGPVNLYFRRDGGAWETLANNLSQNSFNFAVDGPPASASELRVIAVYNSALGDTLSLVGPRQQELHLLSPNDTTCWIHGTPLSFIWQRVFAEGELTLEVNRTFPSQDWEVLASNLLGEHWTWNSPTDLENGAVFRLSLSTRESVADSASFSCVLYPDLDLQTPADTLLRTGQTQWIEWSRNACEGAVNVFLNRNYPSGFWEPVYSGSADGFPWTAGANEEQNIKFKIQSELFPQAADTSDYSLTVYTPRLTLALSPRQEIYYLGDTLNISFSAVHESPSANIALQRTEGGAWETLFSEISNGAYSWIVSGDLSETARIKVFADNDPLLADTSERFAIDETPRTLIFTAPLESGIDTAGTELTVSWAWSEGDGLVKLEVSREGTNGPWNLVADSLTELSYNYFISGPETDSLRFRITALEYTTVRTISVARAVIVPSLTVDIGGETWYIGSQHWIHWSTNHYSGMVNLEINRADRAEAWENLSSAVEDSFLWTVTGPEADHAALRITGDYGLSDTTDVPLRIRAPRVQVIAPNGGEHLVIDETIRLRWIAEGLDSPIAIGLWRGDPVNRFDTLFIATENDSEEIWTITGPAASGCYLAVFFADNLALRDTSDGAFFIDLADAAENPAALLPKEFSLQSAYPNPFNSELNIEYALPTNTRVTLALYNLLGQEVARLEEKDQIAGIHKTRWKADGLASGVYLLRMQTLEYIAAKKIHFLK